jgi:hypothetical protein
VGCQILSGGFYRVADFFETKFPTGVIADNEDGRLLRTGVLGF